MRLILFLALSTVAFGQGISHSIDVSIAVRRLGPEARLQDGFIKAVSLPMPEYPASLADAGIAGEASVRFRVGESGAVSEFQLLKVSQSEFVSPITEAVRRWRFQVYARDGTTKVERSVWMTCIVQFRREED